MNNSLAWATSFSLGALLCGPLSAQSATPSNNPAPIAAAQPASIAPRENAPRQASTAQAGAEALGASAVVARAIQNNPSLEAVLLQTSQAEANVRAEEGLYAPVGSLRAGVTHGRAPSLRQNGVSISTSDTVDVGGNISKPFSFGTVVALDVGGQRSLRSSPILPTSPDEVTLGPGYGVTATLSVTQPLLRGFGNDVGLASLRSARISERASRFSVEQAASGLVRDVLTGYWELWFSEQVVRINAASRDLAREQARQANEQVKSGSLARIDALVYTTRLAELEETVLSGLTDRSQRVLTVGVLMGDPGLADGFVASDSPAEPSAAADEMGALVAEALAVSPEVAQLEANVALAREQLKVAGESLRPRLDLDASLTVAGLGDQRVPPAFEQFGGLDAVGAHVGLTFEAPLDDTRRQAQVAAAGYAERISQKQLEATRLRLQNDVKATLNVRNNAFERLRVTSDTVRVAEQQAEAERQRFSAGASIAIQVQQAEESLRQAQLRLVRARVDWTLAELDLAHLRGRLLERFDNGRRLKASRG